MKYALAQEITNRALLTQTANRSKSDRNAIDYLQSVQTRFPNALALQSIPDDIDLWRIENYEQFLAARRRMLAAELNAFLTNIANLGESNVPTSIDDLIADGESDELEFKSSLRWDYQQQVPNKKLEEIIVKGVAAFANAQGGTLLIGVNDGGDALGLERDYSALGNGGRDEFELHLRTLLNKNVGEAFVAAKIKVTFPTVLGVEICQLAIQPSQKPIIVQTADKNGQAVEKFYVRNGNSSREMPLREMHTYVSERFT